MIFQRNPATAETADAPDSAGAIAARFASTRKLTRSLIEPLSPEDCCVQSMADASPAKWHLAHTTWFFEEFILKAFVRGYEPVHPQFSFLFNSYYNAVGERQPRPKRGLLTRPPLDDVLRYGDGIDRLVKDLLTDSPTGAGLSIATLVEIGINHEQQHQELLLTDIKNLLFCNPLSPAYRDRAPTQTTKPPQLGWTRPRSGQFEVGHAGDGFAHDNESPRHRVYLEPFQVADRLVTVGEYLEFIGSGGYERPELWLDEGWTLVQSRQWSAPLYWRRDGQKWLRFTLAGPQPLNADVPVTHVSFFEADAFARWLGVRLPTEAEWEVVARDPSIEGAFLEDDRLDATPARGEGMKQLFGDAWEWTGSQYRPYPGYLPPEGALGEYNGKFMSNQFVLRGGSCATPRTHIRRTYRNFFQPNSRWQFSGIRLGRSVRA